MDIIKTAIPDVVLIKPEVYVDARGSFRETYREERYQDAGISCKFVQDNLVHSKKNVLRGLHFQLPPFEQAKLITMIRGEILDIVIDLRKGSDTYLKQLNIPLSAEKGEQLFIPAGFAHGYYVRSESASISYKVSAPYSPGHQSGIRWNDPHFDLKNIIKNPLLSQQDINLPLLKEVLE